MANLCIDFEMQSLSLLENIKRVPQIRKGWLGLLKVIEDCAVEYR